MPIKPTQELEKATDTLKSWLPSEQREYVDFVFRLIASLPGGEELEDMGYEPYPFLGWQEADMIGKLLEAIQGKRDVEYVVEQFKKEFMPEEES